MRERRRNRSRTRRGKNMSEKRGEWMKMRKRIKNSSLVLQTDALPGLFPTVRHEYSQQIVSRGKSKSPLRERFVKKKEKS